MAETVGIIGTALSEISAGEAIAYAAVAAGTAYAANSQANAAQAQRRTEKKNAALARAADALANAKAARQAVARASVARAEAESLGQSQLGNSTSSGVQGATGSLLSQTAGNIGFSSAMASVQYGINANNQRLSQDISKYNTRATIGAGIAQMGQTYIAAGLGGTQDLNYTGPTSSPGPGILQSSMNPGPIPPFRFSNYAKSYGSGSFFR